jgi:hypothetical protein
MQEVMAALCRVALPLVVLTTVIAGCAGGEQPTYQSGGAGAFGIELAPAGTAAGTPPAPPAATTAAGPVAKAAARPKPVGITHALSRSCRSQLQTGESAAAGRIAKHRRLKQDITAKRRDLTRLAREHDRLRAALKPAYRKALRHRTNANIDAYNSLVRRSQSAVRAYNAEVDALNREVDQANALARTFTTAQHRYERTRDTCLRRIHDWVGATAAITAALTVPAAAAGTTTPGVVCEQPEAPHRHRYDKLGFVQLGTPVIHLAASACLGLERVASRPGSLGCALQRGSDISCPPAAADAVISIVVLAHEEQHVDGVVNEAQAQCYAYQRADATARRLGVPRAVAKRVAPFTDVAFEQPGQYHSSECHRGGTYDLGLRGAPPRWTY